MQRAKPSYSTTRTSLRLNTGLAWIVILAIVGGGLAGVRTAVELASIVVPSLVVLIAGILGIHRFAGAMDMRTMAEARLPRMDEEDEPAGPPAEDEANEGAHAPRRKKRGDDA